MEVLEIKKFIDETIEEEQRVEFIKCFLLTKGIDDRCIIIDSNYVFFYELKLFKIHEKDYPNRGYKIYWFELIGANREFQVTQYYDRKYNSVNFREELKRRH